jgi:endonuclease III
MESARRQLSPVPLTRRVVVAKRAFDIDLALKRIEKAVEPYPKAALFELADRGYDTPFEQLVACLISIRTRDEVTTPTALALFEIARTPQALARLSAEAIAQRIRACTFARAKAAQLHALAHTVVKKYGGQLPCDFETLIALKGVGPKCANLVLGVACGQSAIGVDIHVHRVTNRWGYVAARTPERTMAALHGVLPRHYWVAINRLLVPFGKHVCTGTRPRCSRCPVRDMCRQVGVTAAR